MVRVMVKDGMEHPVKEQDYERFLAKGWTDKPEEKPKRKRAPKQETE